MIGFSFRAKGYIEFWALRLANSLPVGEPLRQSFLSAMVKLQGRVPKKLDWDGLRARGAHCMQSRGQWAYPEARVPTNSINGSHTPYDRLAFLVVKAYAIFCGSIPIFFICVSKVVRLRRKTVRLLRRECLNRRL
jgi:hypothetical protein